MSLSSTHIGLVQWTRCPVSSLLLWYRAMPLVLTFSLSSTHWASAVHRVPGHLSLALVPGNAFSRGWQIFFYDDGERVHAYTLHAHNLFDGKGCMHAPSCHHHVSRVCTGQEVHAHPFSQYAFCMMAAASRCWWWRGGIYMHPRPAFFSSFFIIILSSAKTSKLASRVKG
jgi:hypothetical protein